MADIAMCRDDSCEKREQCYRYTAPIGYRQTTFTTPPDKPCKFFWDNTGRIDGRKIGRWWQNGAKPNG